MRRLTERCHDPEELQRLVGAQFLQAASDNGGGAMSMGGMMIGGDSYA